jgi:hypothetical protein
LRHVNVHEDDVRQQLAGFAQGLDAVGGLAHNGQMLLARQASADPPTDDRMIVHQ